MRYEKYNKENRIVLSCRHFNEKQISCCSSCHEDVSYGVPLCESKHPKNSNVQAIVCCGILNNELETINEQEELDAWEEAIERYEKEQ